MVVGLFSLTEIYLYRVLLGFKERIQTDTERTAAPVAETKSLKGPTPGFLAGFSSFFHQIFLAVEPPGSSRKKYQKTTGFINFLFASEPRTNREPNIAFRKVPSQIENAKKRKVL